MLKLKLLTPFNISERADVLMYKMGKLLIRKSKPYVRICYHLTSELINKGIAVKRFGVDCIRFDYLVNNKLLSFTLNKRSSDIHVFHQIIMQEEYEIINDICNENNIELNTIIDAGANIGLTSLYFAAFYPKARIISFEPSEINFKRLKTNILCNPSNSILMVQKGLWSYSGLLAIKEDFRDNLDWSFSLKEANNNELAKIEVISIEQMFIDYNIDKIDFFKIDIEGAEKQLFEKMNYQWLDKVRLIAVEVHTECISLVKVIDVLEANNFRVVRSRELTIGIKRNI